MAISKAVKVPDTLYHYCGINGFLGIIQSKSLWLSNASMLNDYMELKWFLIVAFPRLMELLSPLSSLVFEKNINYMIETIKHSPSPYICCFSSNPDLLSQWRAYADDGAGFAIGFSTDKINNICSSFRSSIQLAKVEYKVDKQKELLNTILDNNFKNIFRRKKKNVAPCNFAYYMIQLHDIAIKCKNPAFIEEDEWRLILNPKCISSDLMNEFCFRNSGARIVPYVTVNYLADAVTEIVLGPKNPAREDRKCLEFLLNAKGYDFNKNKIINSNATYR